LPTGIPKSSTSVASGATVANSWITSLIPFTGPLESEARKCVQDNFMALRLESGQYFHET
jgi:hypothetical protein